MARYPISEQGAASLRALSEKLVNHLCEIAMAGRSLQNRIRGEESQLGEYGEKILEMLARQQRILRDACNSIEQLSTIIMKRADEIEELLRSFAGDYSEKYTFETDSEGRTVSAKGSLKLQAAIRDAKAQLEAGGNFRRDTDDGGHLIGARFKGPSNAKNMIAQNRRVNRSHYKALENEWERLLQDGNEVDVEIYPVYQEHTTRPHAILGNYTVRDISGVCTQNYFSFTNENMEDREFDFPEDYDEESVAKTLQGKKG